MSKKYAPPSTPPKPYNGGRNLLEAGAAWVQNLRRTQHLTAQLSVVSRIKVMTGQGPSWRHTAMCWPLLGLQLFRVPAEPSCRSCPDRIKASYLARPFPAKARPLPIFSSKWISSGLSSTFREERFDRVAVIILMPLTSVSPRPRFGAAQRSD